jgi:phenylacetate-CoA ligase
LFVRRFIARAQWWDAERIERWQVSRLRRMAAYAVAHVPGYAQLYREARIDPHDLRSLQDARALPFVTKMLLRDNLKDFTSRRVPRAFLRYLTTSGSTGIPFGFHQTAINTSVERAFMHAGWERAGWRLGDTAAVLRGAHVGTEDDFWDYRPYERELLLSSYYLTDATYPRYDEVLARFAPLHLQAYPSALSVLSDLVSRHGRRFPDFRTLLLGSENLYGWQAELFRRTFPSSRLFGWYGHAEQAILAPMCERSSDYHAWPFYGWTEVIDEAGADLAPGGTGELVGTSFWSFATPFIRYRTMDMATPGGSRCKSCGRHGLLLTAINGRLQEMVVTGTGRLISMTAINMHDDAFDDLKQFQFFQDTPGRVVFRYVSRRILAPSEVERIRQRLVPKLGPDTQLEMAPVAEIARTPAGKMRFLDQRLSVRFGDR